MAYDEIAELMPSEETTQEQMTRYLEGMMRGQSGRRLAATAGIPIVPPTPAAVAPPIQTQWSHVSPAPGTEGGGDYDQIMRSVSGLPVDQAMKAVNAAKQFMAIRGYQKDLEAGKPADETLAKWAPLGLMGDKASLSGAASFIRATQPKPRFSFVPGKEGEPATYQAAGQRPVIVPRTALPVGGTPPELLKQEVAPGIFAVRDPRSPSIHIVKGSGEDLTRKDRLMLMSRLPKMRQDAIVLSADNPEEYAASLKEIEAVRAAAMGESGVPGVPTAIPYTPPPEVAGRAWEPGAVPAPAPVEAAPSMRVFRDKSGNRYRYIGTSPNPKEDRNPDNWVKE